MQKCALLARADSGREVTVEGGVPQGLKVVTGAYFGTKPLYTDDKLISAGGHPKGTGGRTNSTEGPLRASGPVCCAW